MVRPPNNRNGHIQDICHFIFDLNPLAIMVCDHKGRYLRVNKAYLDLFKEPPHPSYSLFDDTRLQQGEAYNKLLNLHETRTAVIPEAWYIKGGKRASDPDSRIYVRSLFFTVPSGSGKTELIIMMQENVTEYHHEQAALMNAHEELERKVSERTRTIEQTKTKLEAYVKDLEAAQKAMLLMVEDLNRQSRELAEAQDKIVRTEKLAALGELAGVVAHELRNPLGAIRNSAYYLEHRSGQGSLGGMDTKTLRHLDIIDKEISAADMIISNVLEFGRMKEPVLKPQAISVCVARVMPRLDIRPPIFIKTELDEKLPPVLVDIDQINLVLHNVLANSIQSMQNGGICTISASVKNDMMEISVRDEGEGISPENLEKIFEPLYSTKIKGSGLGLSVCKNILQKHGGSIKIESQMGKGTTCRILLPITNGEKNER